MTAAPEGTVTLLFTDVEGSTKLLHATGDAYGDLLLAHRRLLRSAFAAHGGHEVDTQGDAFFVAFASARDAAAAALAGQDALACHDWPPGCALRVRMGLHTGEPRLRDGGYVGLDVHLAARVMAAGHGGQVLLTTTTRDLLGDDLPVRDLGEHRLKDIAAPARLFQLGEADFPSLRTAQRSHLPVPATPFLGRGRELAELRPLIEASRLVTLTGSGGSGKTRLALAAASEAADEYHGGAWFVPLTAIRDAAAVLPALAVALELHDESLDASLGSLHALVVLDNLEQIDDIGAVVSQLLERAPEVTLLATSRARLGLNAEQEYPVPTLEPLEALELFTARARRLRPQFEPDAAAVAICERLDGLPLAIELAAGRVNALTAEQILERLGRSLDLLTSRASDAPDRQRTLRATIDWSYGLLSPAEAAVLARLGVFPSSFTLDAAESVAGADLEELALLVDKNLVRSTGEGRFFLYEALRAYARERLAELGEAESVARAQAQFYTELAERAEPELEGRNQIEWLDVLDAERDNLRTALEWAYEHDPQVAVRIVGALWLFWSVRGPLRESVALCERALATSSRDTPALERGLLATSYLTARIGNGERARALAEDAIERYRAAGDVRGVGRALRDLGNALSNLSDWDGARAAYEACAEASRTVADEWNLAIALNNLGYVARGVDDLERAFAYCDESVNARRVIGDWRGLVLSLQNRSLAELGLDLLDEARATLAEALRLGTDLGYREGVSGTLLPLGAVEVLQGRYELGLRLMGAAVREDEETGFALEEPERRIREQALDAARYALGDAFEQAWREACEWTLEAATAEFAETTEAAV